MTTGLKVQVVVELSAPQSIFAYNQKLQTLDRFWNAAITVLKPRNYSQRPNTNIWGWSPR